MTQVGESPRAVTFTGFGGRVLGNLVARNGTGRGTAMRR